MKIASIKNDFFTLCSFDKELLNNDNRRPYLIIVRLKYFKLKQDFAIPFRSNISNTTPQEQYFALPPRKTTQKGRIHGLHFVKMFPCKDEYLEKFHTDKDPYYRMLVDFVYKNRNAIINQAQTYIDNYIKGIRPPYCTDIHEIYAKIYGIDISEIYGEISATKDN